MTKATGIALYPPRDELPRRDRALLQVWTDDNPQVVVAVELSPEQLEILARNAAVALAAQIDRQRRDLRVLETKLTADCGLTAEGVELLRSVLND